MSALDAANTAQRAAADPGASVFVTVRDPRGWRRVATYHAHGRVVQQRLATLTPAVGTRP